MPQQIDFDGELHEFPDDFTPQDISKALASSKPTPAPRGFAGMASDAADYMGNLKDNFSADMHQRGADLNKAVNAPTAPEAVLPAANWAVGTGADMLGTAVKPVLDAAYFATPDWGKEALQYAGEKAAPIAQQFNQNNEAYDAANPRMGAQFGAIRELGANLAPLGNSAVRKGAGAALEAGVDASGNAVKNVVKDSVDNVATGAKNIAGADLRKSGDIFDKSSASYAESEQLGGALKPEFSDKFIDSVKDLGKKTDWGKATTGEDAISSLVSRYELQRGKPISLQAAKEIDEGMTEIIDGFYDNKGKINKQGLKVQQAQHAFRDMIENAPEEHLVGGKAGFESWKRGQNEWSTALRIRDMEQILEKADAYDNPATYIKGRFRQLEKSGMRGYNDAEKAAIKHAARSGIVGNTLRTVLGGRWMAGTVGAGAGFGAGGPIGAMAGGATAAALSGVGRKGAEILQTGRANNAIREVGKRMDIPEKPPFAYNGEVLPPEKATTGTGITPYNPRGPIIDQQTAFPSNKKKIGSNRPAVTDYLPKSWSQK